MPSSFLTQGWNPLASRFFTTEPPGKLMLNFTHPEKDKQFRNVIGLFIQKNVS